VIFGTCNTIPLRLMYF